ncbi:MAG: hypothetical protein BWY78_01413 [Alphaproteobacteria bacterium ADurb.Bin438]|nr:MAG: hypothetical protein BWY78_01413 [Alphaproteobacteria bacterium ADurb.Bin438]
MENFTNFIGNRYTYSYGKDFLRPIIQSCFYTGTFCKVKAKQTRDIRKILLKANMSLEEIQSNSSGSLAKHFGINFDFDFEHIHDARYDAMSIIATLRHLENQNRLDINWLIE